MPLRGRAFSVASHTPYPYQLCYCSICRKTAGGGGYAINLMGDVSTLKVKGRKAIGVYRAKICDDDGGNCEVSTGERNFCTKCASALWLFDPTWPDLVHPFASIIDTPLPVPPARTHLMLRYKPSWVKPAIGKKTSPSTSIPSSRSRTGTSSAALDRLALARPRAHVTAITLRTGAAGNWATGLMVTTPHFRGAHRSFRTDSRPSR